MPTAPTRLTTAIVAFGLFWVGGVFAAANSANDNVQPPRSEGAARTVWDSVYTVDQATRGATAYRAACASCHADDLRGKSTAPSLVGDDFMFQWGDRTVGELFERIRTLMPSDRPNTLSKETYRDIVAFVLQGNTFPPGSSDLSTDLDELRHIMITAQRPASR